MKKMKNNNISIQSKLIMIFIFTSCIVFAVNIFMFININAVISKIDEIYMGNVRLNELSDALFNVQDSMTEYLNTKGDDSIERYFRSEQDYQNQLENLNINTTNNNMQLMEKNIRNMSESYLTLTNETVQSKRGRIIEKYKISYENASDIYNYINTYIYSLNNEQFKYNTGNYDALLLSFRSLELVTFTVLIMITIANVILAVLMTRTITNPLSNLARAANEVASGNLEIDFIEVKSNDEVGVVSKAFNKMIQSIREYIIQIRENMEIESAMKEKELMMETHLKDAELKYLQAQINPHFLFNTLNAGAQLAMMEGADKTYRFIQNMASFFRYNIKKDKQEATLADEIKLVDNYIYILNVRFSGEIHFEKQIDEQLVNVRVPSMILQPIVENAINYGIRDIDWEGLILLKVTMDHDEICISIKDNGIGMSQERIDEVLRGEIRENDPSADSNGVGLGNVINRLKLFYEKEDVLDIFSEGKDKGTEVVIYIPVDNQK